MTAAQIQPAAPVHQPFERRKRQAVNLPCHAVLQDLSLVEVVVDDLSFDGCGIQIPTPLVVGETIRLSLLERGLIEAHVRSYADGRAGVVFDPEPEDPKPDPQRERQTERVALLAEVTMRRLGKGGLQARVFDASTHGCQVEYTEPPAVDEMVRIRLDGLQPLNARICWIDDERAGLEFEHAIHPAVFDLLVARAQAKPRAA